MKPKKKPEFASLPVHLNIEDICIQKGYRKIRNDHTFSYGNKFYQIKSQLKYSIAMQKIEIRKQSKGSICVYFAGQKINIAEVIEPTKASVYDLEIQKKIDAINLAEKLDNVSEAARISGCSRETIYKNRRLLKEKGPEALKRNFKPNNHYKNRTAKDVERRVITYSLENPHLGQAQVSAQLRATYGITLSSSAIRNIWLRENMNTAGLRLMKAKSSSACA